jgi:hypothetical protein
MRISSERFAVLCYSLAISLPLIVLSGCQYSYPVELRGVVYNARDGAPMPGVTVMFSPRGYPNVFPLSSGNDGSFRASFDMSDIDFDSDKPWSVLLKKEGYHDATVDLGPFEEPKSSGPIRIVVAVTMREKGGS